MSSRRVLFVSYFYPPFSSVGAGRVSKMTRYLADHGWDATVLTIDRDDRPATMAVEIPVTSIRRVPQSGDVLSLPRTVVGRRTVRQRRFVAQGSRASHVLWRLGMVYRNVVCFPDPQIGWLRPAIREGLRAIEEIRPHAIVTTSSPSTCHLVGASLARRTGLPWVAEFRDLWTDNHNFRRAQPLLAVERWLERRTLEPASALVTVSELWAERLHDRFGKPVHVVPNGFDPTDYPVAPYEPSHVFLLSYTGMFYNGKQNAAPLIEAIAGLSRDGVITPESFQLRLVGHYLEPVAAAAEKAGIGRFVELAAPVTQREALTLQRNATVLLFLDWSDGREKGWYSAKLYEYLGARRPILSVGPEDSVVAQLIEGLKAGAAASEARRVRSALETWLREFRSTGTVVCHSESKALVPYERQAAAEKMAETLNLYVAR